MKHYTGVKPLSVIRAQCAQQGVAVDDWAHRKCACGFIYFGRQSGVWGNGQPFVETWQRGHARLDVFSGRFEGRNMAGEHFNSADTTHAHEPWFQALLDFFYVEG